MLRHDPRGATLFDELGVRLTTWSTGDALGFRVSVAGSRRSYGVWVGRNGGLELDGEACASPGRHWSLTRQVDPATTTTDEVFVGALEFAVDSVMRSSRPMDALLTERPRIAVSMQVLRDRLERIAAAAAVQCEPRPRELALRFDPDVRRGVYALIAGDPSGFMAQLAVTAPDVVLRLCEHDLNPGVVVPAHPFFQDMGVARQESLADFIQTCVRNADAERLPTPWVPDGWRGPRAAWQA